MSRNAKGAGTIEKRTVTKNGKAHVYWVGRLTLGYDPGTGKQIRRSFTGSTQKEVRQAMQAAAVSIDSGTYQTPQKMTVGEWLDIWAAEYLGSVKPRTVDSYTAVIANHLKPAFGAVKLQALQAHQIQKFYNDLQKRDFSPKSIKNFHGVLHSALSQAVDLGYLHFNPSMACKLPRIEKPEIKPLDEKQISLFLTAIQGQRFEYVFFVVLFTGMREGELLGLTWDCISFKSGTVMVKQQLQRKRDGSGEYTLASTKNGKGRTITPAPSVMKTLLMVRRQQAENQLKTGELWDNPLNLVFTNEFGRNLSAQTVYLDFKKVAKEIGCPDARFHDLRHSYAVAALRSGDDIKSVQEALGHHTAAFTMDTYLHVTDQMKQANANRMEAFIKGVSNL